MIKGYITNLGKYNEGELTGEWIAFPIEEDELAEVFKRIGINDQYEEYFFTDWECELPLDLGEYISISKVNEYAEALEDCDVELVSAILEATGCDIDEALEWEDDVTFYKGMKLSDVAYELVESCYDLPEFAQRYFNYEAFARDLSFDGYTEVAGGVIRVR